MCISCCINRFDDVLIFEETLSAVFLVKGIKHVHTIYKILALEHQLGRLSNPSLKLKPVRPDTQIPRIDHVKSLPSISLRKL